MFKTIKDNRYVEIWQNRTTLILSHSREGTLKFLMSISEDKEQYLKILFKKMTLSYKKKSFLKCGKVFKNFGQLFANVIFHYLLLKIYRYLLTIQFHFKHRVAEKKKARGESK